MRELPEKLSLTSMNIKDERIESLRNIFPEIFQEGRIDLNALQHSLGNWVEQGKERFGLNWPGKSELMKIIQQPSVGTLLPMRGDSVNFDTSENLIIEGDNLEVLKLLQKSYYGKVKLIYIDPPYNTGNEFIYPDNFHEGLQDYLKYSGQVDGNGLKLSTNSETNGRYHSKWLSMMYPRLFLARNLLREDGVIFISIDDHEVANLLLLMNEIFGEENMRANISWKKKYAVSNNFQGIASVRDFILCYSKSNTFENGLFPRTDEDKSRYSNPDNDARGPWKAVDYWNQATPDKRPNLVYSITNPFTGQVVNPTKKAWKYSKETHEQHIKENRIWWGEKVKNSVPALKLFLKDVRDGLIPDNFWNYKEAGHTDAAKKELDGLFEVSPFDTPKPTQLIKRICNVANLKSGDIVLDFFAGSGTTAHALLDINNSTNQNLKFILVQLPEKIDSKKYPTIADITRDRVRRVMKTFHTKEDKDSSCLGFKSFKLSSSNFKIWQSEVKKNEEIGKSLELFIEHVAENRTNEDILYEVMLKVGYSLTESIKKVLFANKETFSIGEGILLICLERNLTLESIEAMVNSSPRMILCLDDGFQNNDQLKVNAVQTVKLHNQNTKDNIEFKVI